MGGGPGGQFNANGGPGGMGMNMVVIGPGLQAQIFATDEEWKVIGPLLLKASAARQLLDSARVDSTLEVMNTVGGRGGPGGGGNDAFGGPGAHRGGRSGTRWPRWRRARWRRWCGRWV